MVVDIPQGVGFVLTAFSILAILLPYVYQQNPESEMTDERRDILSLYYILNNKDSTLDEKEQIWS